MSCVSLYTEDIAKDICRRLIEGETLRAICNFHQIGCMTVYDWKRDHPEFERWYLEARLDRADTLFEEILEVGEEATRKGKSKEEILGLRVKMDGLKFSIARMNPAKYGDKLIHAGDPEHPINFRALSDEELVARATKLLGRVGAGTNNAGAGSEGGA